MSTGPTMPLLNVSNAVRRFVTLAGTTALVLIAAGRQPASAQPAGADSMLTVQIQDLLLLDHCCHLGRVRASRF